MRCELATFVLAIQAFSSGVFFAKALNGVKSFQTLIAPSHAFRRKFQPPGRENKVGRPQRCDYEIDLDVLSELDCNPLLVFVNTRSGGRLGCQIMDIFSKVLHDFQVVDLDEQDAPEEMIEFFAPLHRLRQQANSNGTSIQDSSGLRALCCGGDGTVGWVLSLLKEVSIPLAIMPLGTGNDLARVTGWGGGFDGSIDEKLAFRLLDACSQAQPCFMDRWSCTINPPKQVRSGFESGEGAEGGGADQLYESIKSRQILSSLYLGLGIDARVTLDFHEARKKRPTIFFSRMVNKLLYGYMAAISKRPGALVDKVAVDIDGKSLQLPTSTQSVVLLNVNSYMGGVQVWCAKKGLNWRAKNNAKKRIEEITREMGERQLKGARHDDGVLEVVAINGVLHLAFILFGFCSPNQIGQGSRVRIVSAMPLPLQIDGEPMNVVGGSELIVEACPSSSLLLRNDPERYSFPERGENPVAQHLIRMYDNGV
uniref:Diacylglycerol kinase n=1 Tax=Octactis speculum TaxID=3111310 RepID=A0A7S2MF19_9STRA|mmetsp:Transcript_61020/g.83799  ORF Transcript_61020/g.83799 Transcript_61020/m.83799 type:complete len:481 (+) Transcript_61020:90-1532(+)|eukprot:CAMPEP_0185748372 /NCGR_PEP_ID=MMETSP1174-20130828/7053_1 /TAXON_ID=35687 /ORGANISM="Dictyocha speculum, Strain CCMP1381" /LENGTH=480 /DNA_ID=CAMNT_0028424007 /DNA_START=90 /DNA_END=1532 /DNA_ORIENTATION=-